MIKPSSLVLAGWLAGLVLFPAAGAHGQNQRHFQFEYEVIVRDLPASASKVQIWLPVPPDLPEQEVLSFEVSAPMVGEIKTEQTHGNKVWYAVTPPPAGGELRIVQRVEVVRKELMTKGSVKQPSIHKPLNLNLYLQPNRMVPLTDRFSKIAVEMISGKGATMGRARALYDHVLTKMSYDKSINGWGRGDANFACDVGKGNCSDFHSFFIALSRSVEMPSRFWIGFPLPPERGQGAIGGYHCWAEFLDGDVGWVPVDISEADKHPEKAEYFFGNLDENRIVYTLGRDLILPPGQSGPPVNFFVYPYVEVDGKPWAKVDRKFSFKDLN